MNAMKPKTVLQQVIGKFGATAISIGGIIGSGIFFLISTAAARAGSAVVLSFIIAGIIALATSLSFASLSSKVVKEGGEYQFIYAAFGPKIGFLVGMLWIVATGMIAVTVSIAFASYLIALFPLLPLNVTAAFSVTAFMLIEAVGIRISSKVNNLLVLTKVGALLFFIAFSLFFFNPANLNFAETGAQGILAGTFLLFFAYPGFEKVTSAAEEVKNPEKTVPMAIIASITVAIILYSLVSASAVGAVGAKQLSQFANAPLANVMLSLGFSEAFLLLAIGALAATGSVILIQMLSISRTVYAMAENKQLPGFFSELHPRFKTPYRAHIVFGAIMAIAAFFLNQTFTLTWTSLMIMLYYCLINVAALVVKKQNGKFNVHPAIPIAGLLSTALLMISYFFIL